MLKSVQYFSVETSMHAFIKFTTLRSVNFKSASEGKKILIKPENDNDNH